jgi:hypothetical protein
MASFVNHPAATRQSITALAALSRSGLTVQGTSSRSLHPRDLRRRWGILKAQWISRHTGPLNGSGGRIALAPIVKASRKGLIFAVLFFPTKRRPFLVRRICVDD